MQSDDLYNAVDEALRTANGRVQELYVEAVNAERKAVKYRAALESCEKVLAVTQQDLSKAQDEIRELKDELANAEIHTDDTYAKALYAEVERLQKLVGAELMMPEHAGTRYELWQENNQLKGKLEQAERDLQLVRNAVNNPSRFLVSGARAEECDGECDDECNGDCW